VVAKPADMTPAVDPSHKSTGSLPYRRPVCVDLGRFGHEVEIREAGPLPGGFMHFGIPAYRLPRGALVGEIRRVDDAGLKIGLNRKVEDLFAEKAEETFDAAFANLPNGPTPARVTTAAAKSLDPASGRNGGANS
jgi:NADPH-dependent glutamate synthase beta subunit-like oxidoreductase